MGIRTGDEPVVYTVLTLSVLGLTLNTVSILYKLIKQFSLPKLWKFSYITLDFAHAALALGLLLFVVFKFTGSVPVCDTSGFFIQFALFDCACGYLSAGIILLGIYNPGKSTQLSKFHRNVFLVILIPPKIISILLSALPFILVNYYSDTNDNYTVTCLKIISSREGVGTVGILSFCVIWITIILGFTSSVISALKLRKKVNNRIHSSSPNVWQTQLVSQGKSLQKILISESVLWIIELAVVNVSVYVGSVDYSDSTGIVYVTLSVVAVIHAVLSCIGDVMWSSCCCFSTREVEEPHRKLKKLELVKLEAPGKLRLRATWNHASKSGNTKRGLMKVYGPSHLKEWAQEIVVLGMLRKSQHPSLLQCLWTSSSNPYYETMTLITGEIITSDSRIICLELTNSGTLSELLRRNEVSLPETCQRMIVHDVAEGLFYLHSQNILHNNLNTSSIYLKGSLPNMVMRAAIGDFEDTQIYGSLQQTTDSPSVVTKRQFFLPDIRSFALIAFEIVSKMCERRFLSMQYEWDSDNENEYLMNISPKHQNQKEQQRYPRGEINGAYSDDSDFEQEELRRRDVIYSPYELIEEEKRRRSRSHSPGSRPLSAQSKRSIRSRTLSPDASRWHTDSPAGQSLYASRSNTPDFDHPLPSSRVMSSLSKGSQSGRNFTPEPNSRPMTPLENGKRTSPFEGNKKKEGKSKSSKSKEKDSQAFEGRPTTPKKSKGVKKSDSKKLLSKPVSLLKNLTGSETTVSAFKPKHKRDDDFSANEISDEEIEKPIDRFRLSHKMRQDSKNSIVSENSLHRTISQKSDQWSIRSDMEYRHNGLKNTVSADSRSSLWSNLPLPLETIDVDRDDLDDIIDQLPGMANSLDDRRNPSITEMLSARDRVRHSRQYWQNDGPGTRTFELVDYYDELQGKYVKKLVPVHFLHRTSSGNQIISAPVHRTTSGTQLVHRTTSGLQEIMEGTEEEDDHGKPYFPKESIKYDDVHPGQKIKAKLLRDDETEIKDSKSKSSKKRSKSAKLFRAPQPPLSEEAQRAIELERQESEKIRSKARNKLKRALSGKGTRPVFPLQRTNSKSEIVDVKLANVRKLEVQTKDSCDDDNKEFDRESLRENLQSSTPKDIEFEQDGVARLRVQAQRKEVAERKLSPEKFSKSGVKRYSSFSSNDSCSSMDSSVRVRRADVSLTSGELTSLSSQADADTDEIMTDAECAQKEANLRKLIQHKRSIVDSGFDSESDISDVHGHHSSVYMSDDSAFHDGNRKQKKFSKLQNSGPLSKVSIRSDVHLSEKAFCVTGINSGISNKPTVNKSDSPDLLIEYLPDKDIIPTHEETMEQRPTSSMSRIIEVSSATPDHTKDIDGDEEIQNLSHSHSKFISNQTGRSKTPSVVERPNTPAVLRGPNVMASNPTDASRRYRELVKKGVPLRVSEVSASEFDKLESDGFFKMKKDEKLISGRPYSTGNRKSRKDHGRRERQKKPKIDRIALDDIIREIPEETSPSPGQRSPGRNLLSPVHAKANGLDDSFNNMSENDVAMINQPSEESETASVQNSSAANSVPPTIIPQNQPAVVVDAELYIDRIYSQNSKSHLEPRTAAQQPQILDPDFDSPLLANQNSNKLLRTMSDFPMHGLSPLEEPPEQDNYADVHVSLLSGMNEKHVDRCRRLTSAVHLVSFNDLLPATPEGLDMMKNKLYQGGQLGNVGGQIVDIAKKCWLSENPPTSFDLVMQLMDPVTETEL
ncbi:hypothetical protein FSP39_013605 [Pinctada imbricata]|uniref:non-specific serine/threonine protein kinase n=1 Tax=Pinctada imbricata TaxID=66713 RepID=A0AA89BRY3_PINIB|nr:hypothetical protein FSP39_013605 [Pinctada imbricata]